MPDEKIGKISDVKNYLGFTSATEFMAEWRVLPDADKHWYLVEVAKVI